VKAILEFNLDDPNDHEVYRRHNKANDMASVLWDLCYHSRGEICEECQQKIRDLMEENNINLEEIWT